MLGPGVAGGLRAGLGAVCFLHNGLLSGHPLGVGGAVWLSEQARRDGLLRACVAALAHAGALAHALAQVVELGAAHVATGSDLDALDLGRVHREGALDPDAKGLLAHGEGLTGAMALALDHHALEHLHAAPGALDDLKMDLHAISRREVGHAAQLRALDSFDDAAHDIGRARASWEWPRVTLGGAQR